MLCPMVAYLRSIRSMPEHNYAKMGKNTLGLLIRAIVLRHDQKLGLCAVSLDLSKPFPRQRFCSEHFSTLMISSLHKSCPIFWCYQFLLWQVLSPKPGSVVRKLKLHFVTELLICSCTKTCKTLTQTWMQVPNRALPQTYDVTYLLNDLEDLAVVALGDDELVHVLLSLDVHRTQGLQLLLTNRLLPIRIKQGHKWRDIWY